MKANIIWIVIQANTAIYIYIPRFSIKIIFVPSISLEKASTIPVKDDTELVLNSCEIPDTQFKV
jgi:hypothetical protein